MKMKRAGRVVGLILAVSLVLQFNIINTVWAVDPEPQSPPSKLRIEPQSPDEPAIGYNEFDKYYVDLKWDVSFPSFAISKYLNIYTQEIPKSYRIAKPRSVKAKDVSGNSNSYRLKELNSGTIYYIDATASYTYVEDSKLYRSAESAASNRVKVLTEIDISAYAVSTNKIKIEWDDVWNTDGRIGYKLYISENGSFANTPPIYIGKDQIGPDKPVKVNESTGKLEYIHTARDPGRVYYIRIEPDVNDAELKKNQYSKTVIVSSYILVRTTKIASTESGVIWKLEWSPVVTSLSDSNVKVSYQIYRGQIDSTDLAQYMASVDGTEFFVTLPPGEVEHYFIIRAIVTKDGLDVYEGIRIESERIIVREHETPSYPAAPVLVDKFEKSPGETIISYDEELKPNSATFLWKVPTRGDGQIDTDIMYDIWLVDDPNLIDNPPEGRKIASNISMGSSNYVISGDTVIGYKYVVSNLTPNSTYYFKIVAKKQFIEYVDDILQNVEYVSDPAVKVIITPAGEPINQPNVPAKPPLKVKKDLNGQYMVTESTVTIQLKNLWYEIFNFEENKWEYIRTEKLHYDDVPPFDPLTSVVDDVYYRKVTYDSGVRINVGCVEYSEGMSYEELYYLPADKVVDFPVDPNDPWENPDLNPDGKKHNVDITITDLKPNTVYVIWVRAARPSADLVSEPSDPIVITTNPVIEPPLEKPVVPSFNYHSAGDTYIDLGWEFTPGHYYYLKYGLEDNINTATGNIKVTPEDLENSVYTRITDLTPNTLYYFWIQAEAVGKNGETIRSEWSDSYLVRTLAYIPPDTPKGFGIKNSIDAITKNTITYEWMQEENLEYILELADNVDYEDAVEYKVGMVSEFTVGGLLSNHRYYARLYSYDPVKNLRSNPTQSVVVRTKRSSDDYDSDEDVDNVIIGDFVKKEKTVKDGVWEVRIVGVDADRFVDYVIRDNKLDITVKLDDPPQSYKKLRILVSDKVFKSLTELSENLTFKMKDFSLVIRPGTITTANFNPLAGKASGVDYEICITHLGTFGTNVKNMIFKTETIKIELGIVEGGNVTPVNSVLKPLKVLSEYDDTDRYTQGKTSGFLYDSEIGKWKRLNTAYDFNYDRNTGTLAFETVKLGATAVAELDKDFFDDIYYHPYETSINNVASVHELKSISTRLFEPDNYASLGDTVKFMFDVLDYEYGSDFMNKALKAGFITSADIKASNRNCTAEDAYKMIIRLFELKTGKLLDAKTKSKFIEENGFKLVRDAGKTVMANEPIKRHEVLVLIEKLLVYIGELE
ncbi:MAG: fibronectin type III domain-containing protein [Hungateiclostridium thermocellum]|nr:fibronectin type III domain-containing protein [Acetivibrio thermocellus]